MKNNYKKVDAKGNKLSESIGSGLNLDHFKKVKEARNMNCELRFRISEIEKLKFREYAKKFNVSESEILRNLVNNFVNGKIEIR